jgi:hypothetical protein
MALEHILIGTITRKFGQCGKEGCKCKSGKEYWHGPYYIWTRKENKKTITKSLSAIQAVQCKKAIANMKVLKDIIEHWKKDSLKSLEKIAG